MAILKELSALLIFENCLEFLVIAVNKICVLEPDPNYILSLVINKIFYPYKLLKTNQSHSI